MSKVTISDELCARLRSAAGPVELVDAAGEPVGRLVRYTKVGGYWVEGEWPTEEPTGEAGGRTHTTDEVLAHLHKITEALS